MSDTALQKHFLSDKVEHFTESVIREMTRQAMQYGAINLAQDSPISPPQPKSSTPRKKPSLRM
jgi:aminotransferase